MGRLIGLFFGLIILILVIWILKKIDFAQVYFLILQADIKYIILAFFFIFLNFFMRNVSSLYVTRKIVKPTFWFNFKTIFAGAFVNVITPGAQLGGMPIRAYFLGEKYKKSKTKILGAVFADVFINSLVSLFFIIVSFIYLLKFLSLEPELESILQTVFFSLLLLVIIIFLINLKKNKMDIKKIILKIITQFNSNKKNKKSKIEKIWLDRLGNILNTFKKIFRDRKTVFMGIFISLISWFFYFMAFYLLFLSFNVKVRFFKVIAILSLADLLGEFSPSPGGVGLMEGFMILAYNSVGLDLYIATAVSLLGRIMFYFFSLFIGGLSLIHLKNSLKN
ncbi:MAG: flippase-like domain-containing protein [Candidatus Pacearchaeota archaeon]